MTEPTDLPTIGRTKRRRPGVATNLSLALSGLGQIYCGCLKRGLLHLCIVASLLTVMIFGLALHLGSPVVLCVVCGVLLLIFTVYSAYDARKLALQTRDDYRLKEYNAPWVYGGLAFLFMTLVCGFAITLRENFLEVYHIPGDSMSPTLPKNSKVVVRKDVYAQRDPERDELVVFLNPSDRRQTWVKRVVGLPGDNVEIRDGVVYVNDARFPEEGAVLPDQSSAEKITIPEQHCYVLGDHRANSKDSRQIGPVPMIALIGKVVYSRP